ncbi:MAG: DUF4139 domain-containing protein [Comamonadaceae bacterium]|nr:DUF4139 domain-containing protein [Comamonadaceae bacterium]
MHSRIPASALAAASILIAGALRAEVARIDAVTLYPGSATVERVLHIAAGSTRAVFECLPGQLDARSLQVSGPASVRIGDVNVQVLEREVAGSCDGALRERLRAAEDDLARAQADVQSLQLAQTWLKTQAASPPMQGAASTPAAQIGTTAEALRRSAQETLTRLHQAERTQHERELALKRLQAERGSAQGAKVAVVRVTLATPAEADLRLAYQVRGPSWSPSYRAQLDTRGAQVQLERLALVSQNTGEDWSRVALTLSTGQPLAATQGPLPRPWTLDVPPANPPTVQRERAAAGAMMAMPAPAPAPAEDVPPPSLDVATVEGDYATRFVVPQRVDLPSGGERATLTLGTQMLPVTLRVRTTPALDATAYLVAELPALTGVWPAGPVQLVRDGASVGQGRFNPGASDYARLGLAFGRDESVVVHADPVQESTASGGFTGARSDRTIARAYSVENRHAQPVQLQVLDAAPVSQSDKIRVQSSYEPTPATTAWGNQSGTIAWQQELAAGATARYTARHVISHDEDVRVRERR